MGSTYGGVGTAVEPPEDDPEVLKALKYEYYSAKLDASSKKLNSNEQCVVTQNSLAERYSNMSTADQRFGDWWSDPPIGLMDNMSHDD